MEYLIDEEEIKIEYNESFDCDPLYVNKKDIKEKECKVKDDPFASNTELQLQDTTNNITEHIDIISWYKGIDNDKYICKFCDSSYSSIQTLRRHIKTKHAVQAKIFRKNIAINKRKSFLKCHICKIKFDYAYRLKDHLKIDHKIEGMSSNCQSPKARKNRSLKIQSNYQCPFCDQNLSRQHALKTHIILKHKKENIEQYSCQFCDYRSPLQYYIEVHTSSKHPNTEYSRSLKKYFCDTCGYQTIKKSHYLTHNKTHSHEKNFKCSVCDYATASNSNLKVHLRLHSAEKPYVCSEVGCGYKCSAKFALRSHEMKHNREANFIYCDQCGYKTVYMQCLKRHYARHSSKHIANNKEMLRQI